MSGVLHKLEYDGKNYIIPSIPQSYDQLIKNFEQKIGKNLDKQDIEINYIDQDNDLITISNDMDLKVLDNSYCVKFQINVKKESPFYREIYNQSVIGKKMQNQLVNQKQNSDLEEFSIIKSKSDKNQNNDDSFEMVEGNGKIEEVKEDFEDSNLFEFIMPVHENSTCDICQVSPIQGIRYKCCQCLNFDACEKCYENKVHPHDFKKITIPVEIINKVNKKVLSNIDIVFPYFKDKETEEEMKNLSLNELKEIRQRLQKIKEVLGNENESKIIRVCINTLQKNEEEAIPYSIELLINDKEKINKNYTPEVQKMARQISEILEMRAEKLFGICEKFQKEGIQNICEKIFEDENIIKKYPSKL